MEAACSPVCASSRATVLLLFFASLAAARSTSGVRTTRIISNQARRQRNFDGLILPIHTFSSPLQRSPRRLLVAERIKTAEPNSRSQQLKVKAVESQSERKPAFQFIRNIDETVLPDVHVMRDRDEFLVHFNFTYSKTFELLYTDDPKYTREDIKGIFLIDEEGVIWSDNVWIAEEPQFGEVDAMGEMTIYSQEKYDRLMRFLDRHAIAHGLKFRSHTHQRY
eukprot:jgi/Bigna1/71781/fgenesh1_pg.17_\